MTERTILGFTLLALASFALMMVWGALTGGAASQEPFEVFAPASAYSTQLAAVEGPLRVTLLLDLFFMTGYGGALAGSAALHRTRAAVLANGALLGTALLVGLDLAENLIMLVHLEAVVAGAELTQAQVALQVVVSGAKWFLAALTLVALSGVLPSATWPERVLIWGIRLAMPLGCGLFVTGAADLRLAGGMLILAGMGGGLALLGWTSWRRVA